MKHTCICVCIGFTRKDDQFEGHSSNSKDKAAALSVPPAKKGRCEYMYNLPVCIVCMYICI